MAELIDDGNRPRLEAWLAGTLGAARVSVSDDGCLDDGRLVGGCLDDGRLDDGAVSRSRAVTLEVDGGPRAGRHACVLRAGSAAGIAAGLSMVQEAAVLAVAHGAGMAVPEPIAACDDPAVLGPDFCITRRVGGASAASRPAEAEALPPGLARELGRQLGRLHAVLPDTPGLAGLAMPETSAALDAVQRCRAWLGDAAVRDPVLAWGLRWLEVNAPPAVAPVLCHRDLRAGNCLVEDGRLAAILGWGFAGFGDPMEDLGWFCAVSRRLGLADRADLYAGYGETAGRPVDEGAVAYWEAAAHLRRAAVALVREGRHRSDAERSLEPALASRLVPVIELDLLRHLAAVGPRPTAGRIG